LPILFLTAADGIDILRECFSAGGNDFIVKTDNIDRIIARVDFWAANPARHEALVRQHDVAVSIAAPAPRAVPTPATRLNDFPDLARDEKRAEVRRWIASARGVARMEYGRTLEERRLLIGYVAAMLDGQAANDFGLKLSYADDLMAVLRAIGALDDAGFLQLVDDWVGTLESTEFQAGVQAGRADWEAARAAEADKPLFLLGLAEALGIR
jgi:hypothetical protein